MEFYGMGLSNLLLTYRFISREENHDIELVLGVVFIRRRLAA